MRKTIVFILCLLWFLPVMADRTPVSAVFVPDKGAQETAQDADRKYFPLFLNSLEWIRLNMAQFVKKYYYSELPGSIVVKTRIKVNPAKLKFMPVYRMKNFTQADYQIKFPISWKDSINPDPSWRLWFHSLVWLEPYLDSNNPDSLAAAYCVINDWIVQHVKYPVSKEVFAFDDHSPAERLVILVKAYNKSKEYPPEDPKITINLQLSIVGHIFFVSSLEKYLCWHNHAIIFDERLISALRDLPKFKKRNEILKVAFARVFEQYRYSYTSEGVHKEHSPCYHQGFTSTLNALVKTAQSLNVDVPAQMRRIQTDANEFSAFISLMGRDFPIGDCFRVPYVPKKMKNRKNQPGVMEEQEESMNGSKDRKKGKTFPKAMEFKSFFLSGWVFAYNTKYDMKFSAQSDFFSLSHYQRDETSFVLSVKGKEMIIDPGLFSYDENKVYTYYRSSSAHNMLVVEGLPDDVDLNNTGLSGITRQYRAKAKNSPEVFGVEMTNPHYKKYGVDIRRQFLFPGENEIVVRDVVESSEPRQYLQLFHLAPGAKVSQEGDHLLITWEGMEQSLIIQSNHDSFKVIEGQEKPMQGWYFPSFKEMKPAPVLELKKSGAACIFMTYLTLATTEYSDQLFSKTVKKTKQLVSKLENADSRTLEYLPFPKRWKPARER